MLSKVVPVSRSLALVSRFQPARCMSAHAPAHWKSDREIAAEHQCTMDYMPIPSGSWQEQYDKTNAKYNVYLALASMVFIGTVFAVKKTNAMYLHSRPNLKNYQPPQ